MACPFTSHSVHFSRKQLRCMLTFRKMFGMSFHRVSKWKLLVHLLILMLLWKRLMSMFEVDLSFRCKYPEIIWCWVVEIHLHYLSLNQHQEMQLEIYFGMMETLLVSISLAVVTSIIVILFSYVDSIETKTYNYFEFSCDSVSEIIEREAVCSILSLE